MCSGYGSSRKSITCKCRAVFFLGTVQLLDEGRVAGNESYVCKYASPDQDMAGQAQKDSVSLVQECLCCSEPRRTAHAPREDRHAIQNAIVEQGLASSPEYGNFWSKGTEARGMTAPGVDPG